MTEKYKDWDILNELPEGWIIDKTVGSPCANTLFITNGKSVLNGQKRALLKINKETIDYKEKDTETNLLKSIQAKNDKNKIHDKDYTYPAKTVNDLARLKFKEHLLKDIVIDLTICDIEGWDKKEYINELKKLINEINFKHD
jgi:hypothetical protein